ncbi:MAG TPA: hypothetical protein VFP46_00585 [Candidatus Paceibacterota bacterium]|nr:hypothetical protein [Candidatus Paceibacterota bacterium]
MNSKILFWVLLGLFLGPIFAWNLSDLGRTIGLGGSLVIGPICGLLLGLFFSKQKMDDASPLSRTITRIIGWVFAIGGGIGVLGSIGITIYWFLHDWTGDGWAGIGEIFIIFFALLALVFFNIGIKTIKETK